MNTKVQKYLNYTDAALELLASQKRDWPLAATNYKGLEKVEEKVFHFDLCRIVVQFNPERIRSTTALVDNKTISARKCFLCDENLPEEQKLIPLGNGYKIMVNPFPIFHQHLTISTQEHVDQRIYDSIKPMLEIAAQLPGFTLFYNGPECGASAPDHLHFQAVENNSMPVEEEYEMLKKDNDYLLFEDGITSIRAFENTLRKILTIETSSLDSGVCMVQLIHDLMKDEHTDKVEPMLNLLCHFQCGKWIIHLFPRRVSRPWQFYEQGEEQLLVGPASVELSGFFILPRKVDFEKITTTDIISVMEQVCVDQPFFDRLKKKLKENL